MGFRVWGLRFGGWGSEFGVWGSGSRGEGLPGHVGGRRGVSANDRVNTNSGLIEANSTLRHTHNTSISTLNHKIDAKLTLIAGPREARRGSFHPITRPGQIYYAMSDFPPN